jgi:hypothetical protein
VQVQREAAVLLAQRIEVLSTKSWRDAQASAAALQTDVPDWQGQADALLADPSWASVDTKFRRCSKASRSQLQAVWDAFRNALSQAEAAAADAAAPLPPVPVWADELQAGARPAAGSRRHRRRCQAADRSRTARQGQPTPSARSLTRLEQEIAQGHGKGQRRRRQRLAQRLEGTRQAGRRQAGKPGPRGAGGGRRTGRLAALARRPAAPGAGGQGRGPVRARSRPQRNQRQPGRRGQAGAEGEEPAAAKPQEPTPLVRKPRYRRPQDAGATARPARAVEADGPGRPAQPRAVEALRRSLQRGHKVVEAWLEKVKADAAEHRGQRWR